MCARASASAPGGCTEDVLRRPWLANARRHPVPASLPVLAVGLGSRPGGDRAAGDLVRQRVGRRPR
eukprot:738421-Heterocapsa_arctica.AAC.1